MNLISGKGEISSRLPAFSLFLPGTCPNTRDRRKRPKRRIRATGHCAPANAVKKMHRRPRKIYLVPNKVDDGIRDLLGPLRHWWSGRSEPFGTEFPHKGAFCLARRLADWLTSPGGQPAIGSYEIHGEQALPPMGRSSKVKVSPELPVRSSS